MTEFVAPVKNYRLAVAHEAMNPRKRSTMEDVHRVVEALGEDPSLSYFAVYDGHGGRKIVDYLEPHLEKNVAAELKMTDDASIEERLTRAFLITDAHSRATDNSTSGATAVVNIIKSSMFNGKHRRVLHSANVGDSRAVLCCRHISPSTNKPVYIAKRLTYDHRAEDEGEQKRIQDAGGFIARGRVLGILAVTRSFGDHGMKEFVTAQPYITTTILGSEESGSEITHPFLILACDGVWDVFTDQEAVDFVNEKLEANGGEMCTDAAECLVQASIDRGSADNITAIVIYL